MALRTGKHLAIALFLRITTALPACKLLEEFGRGQYCPTYSADPNIGMGSQAPDNVELIFGFPMEGHQGARLATLRFVSLWA